MIEKHQTISRCSRTIFAPKPIRIRPPNISIFFSDSVLVDENEKPYHNSLQSYTKELDSKLWNSSHFSEGLKYFNRFFIHKCIILNASSAVFKKNYALKHIDEVLDFKTQGDWLFWCLMLKEGNIFYAAEKLNYFRHHSLTTRNYNSKEAETKNDLSGIIDKLKNDVYANKKHSTRDFKP